MIRLLPVTIAFLATLALPGSSESQVDADCPCVRWPWPTDCQSVCQARFSQAILSQPLGPPSSSEHQESDPLFEATVTNEFVLRTVQSFFSVELDTLADPRLLEASAESGWQDVTQAEDRTGTVALLGGGRLGLVVGDTDGVARILVPQSEGRLVVFDSDGPVPLPAFGSEIEGRYILPLSVVE